MLIWMIPKWSDLINTVHLNTQRKLQIVTENTIFYISNISTFFPLAGLFPVMPGTEERAAARRAYLHTGTTRSS